MWDNEGDGDGEVEIKVGETVENRGVEGSISQYRKPFMVSIRTKRYSDKYTWRNCLKGI